MPNGYYKLPLIVRVPRFLHGQAAQAGVNLVRVFLVGMYLGAH